jgi:hypothetical protein
MISKMADHRRHLNALLTLLLQLGTIPHQVVVANHHVVRPSDRICQIAAAQREHHGDRYEAKEMVEGMLADPRHLQGRQESRLRDFLELMQVTSTR